jgi:Family of unknown function (DUF6174)
MSPRPVLLMALIWVSMVQRVPAQSQLELRQSQLLAAAEAKWVELGATSYRYKLRVGGVFGPGEYRVEVRGSQCKSRHVGGIGLGHAKFLERFRSEPNCDGRLIADLLKEVRFDVARGYTLQDVQIDARYGFLAKAYIDPSEKIEDQGWGFEVTEFEVLQ